jgi:hypothetical protein
MADLKISALPASTVPLVGTEVLPIVQGSATRQVTVANLTAGRDVSALTLASTTGATFAITSGSVGIACTPAAWASDRKALQIGLGTSIQGSATTTDFAEYGVNFYQPATGGEKYIYSASATKYRQFANAHSWYRSTSAQVAGTDPVFIQVMGVDSSSNLNVNVGNIVPGTAAKGINFTANTPAAGMTSQLLNWYEEGTWTPADGSGAGLTFTVTGAKYTRIGRLVTCQMQITYPTTASAAQATISGLPFQSGSVTTNGYLGSTAAVGVAIQVATNATSGTMLNAIGASTVTNATLSTKLLYGTFIYYV